MLYFINLCYLNFTRVIHISTYLSTTLKKFNFSAKNVKTGIVTKMGVDKMGTVFYGETF